MILFFFYCFFLVQSQTLVFLNASKCDSITECFASNTEGYYLALNMSDSQKMQVPFFNLLQNELIDLTWQLPSSPLRYISVSVYMYSKSDGTIVFAEIMNSIDLYAMTQLCNLSSHNLLWGSKVRFLLSASKELTTLYYDPESTICNIILPVPGNTYTNLSLDQDCKTQNNPSSFSLLIRLTLPENNTKFFAYLDSNYSTVLVHKTPFLDCRNDTFQFDYPIYNSLWVSNAEQSWLPLFNALVQSVISMMQQQQWKLKSQTSTQPWLNEIHLPQLGGFACINTSSNCQGSTAKGNYFRSSIFSATPESIFIVIGCIHNDFFAPAYYSSLSLYKLANNKDTASGIGIGSVIDSDQRGSASLYINNVNNMNPFYVSVWSNTPLPLLPKSTLFEPLPISTSSSLFFVTRTYLPNPMDPNLIVPEIILEF